MKDLIGALFIVRNEEWCLRASLAAALRYADRLVVYDDRSVDGTLAVLASVAAAYPDRVHLVPPIPTDDRRWPEMRMRQATLLMARAVGCTVLAINDADEVPSARVLASMATPAGRAAVLARIPTPGDALGLSMLSPVRKNWSTLRVDRSFAASNVSWLVRDRQDLAWYDDADRYCHHRRLPRGAETRLTLPRSQGGIFHLQFANPQRLVAKAVWYKMQEVVSFPGRMPAAALNQKYDWAVPTDGESIEPLDPADALPPDLASLVDFDAPPWQLEEARALAREHGPAPFQGLDLYEHVLGPLF